MDATLENLAKAIGNRISLPVPVDVAFWSKKEIGACLQCSTTTVDMLIKNPDFPVSYRFPSQGKGSQPRWRARDVLAWAEKYRGKECTT